MATIKNPVIVIKKTTGGDEEYIKFIERSGTSVAIPEGTTKIADYGFVGWKTLTTVTLPSSVDTLGEGMCYANDSKLNVTSLSSINTENVKYFKNECLRYTSITNIDLSSAVSGGIGNFICEHCSKLKTVTLPDNVNLSSYGIFRYCSNLTTINNSSQIRSLATSTFDGCSNLELASLPNECSYIGQYCFRNCKKITINILPTSLSDISSEAFEGCSGITGKFTWNSNLGIPSQCFKDCSGITEIEIGFIYNRSIQNNAFKGCSSLTKISFPNSRYVALLSNVNALPDGVNWAGTIEVPSALLETWKASTNWSSLTNVTWIGI